MGRVYNVKTSLATTGSAPGPANGEQPPDEPRPTLQRVKQYLANLELSPGATWPEVERAYNRLRERYHPDKHEGHPERHRTAQELTESLTNAYQALRRYFQQ